jgi:hypothetical protein
MTKMFKIGANTLAYYENSQINGSKDFMAVLTPWQNCEIYIFDIVTVALSLIKIIWHQYDGNASDRDKHSSSLQAFIDYRRKMFYNTRTSIHTMTKLRNSF